MLPPLVRSTTQEVTALWEYMTEEERQLADQLLWSPVNAIARYKADPVAFAVEVLHMTLAPYQEEALRLLVEKHRVCFRGPHGAGKTTVAAAAILWFISVYEECKIPTTASAWRQLTDFLWPEIHKWALKADWWRVGLVVRPGKELLKLRLELGANRFAFAISSNDEAKIEGAHSEALFYLFDEAKTIIPAIWDAAEGALGTENAFAMALSTPGDSNGRFYEIQSDRDKYQVWASTYATAEDVIAAGRMTQEWRESRAREWGVESAMYKRRVLGIFADEAGDTVIPLSLIEAANERWHALNTKVKQLIQDGMSPSKAEQTVWGDMTHLGVDPARYGVDKTGWAFRFADYLKKVERTDQQDTMQTTGKMVSHLANNTAIANVDVNGLGAGVFDRGRELWKEKKLRKLDKKCPVIAINTANGTKARDKSKERTFNRLRDYLWWHMRELLEDEHSTVALPPDDFLTRDLTAPKWGHTSSGKIQIEKKEDTKARLGRSPDVGDACVLCFAPDVSPYKPLFATV